MAPEYPGGNTQNTVSREVGYVFVLYIVRLLGPRGSNTHNAVSRKVGYTFIVRVLGIRGSNTHNAEPRIGLGITQEYKHY